MPANDPSKEGMIDLPSIGGNFLFHVYHRRTNFTDFCVIADFRFFELIERSEPKAAYRPGTWNHKHPNTAWL